MEKQTASAQISLKTEKSEKIEAQIKYYIVHAGSEQDDVNSYGIRAELVHLGLLIDSACVQDITPSLQKCEALARLLAKNTVTPATLKDVIEDVVAEDFELISEENTPVETA